MWVWKVLRVVWAHFLPHIHFQIYFLHFSNRFVYFVSVRHKTEINDELAMNVRRRANKMLKNRNCDNLAWPSFNIHLMWNRNYQLFGVLSFFFRREKKIKLRNMRRRKKAAGARFHALEAKKKTEKRDRKRSWPTREEIIVWSMEIAFARASINQIFHAMPVYSNARV